MTIKHLNPKEYHPFYAAYIQKVDTSLSIVDGLCKAEDEFFELLKPLSEEKMMHRYAEGKWSIKEIVSHLADGERIFGARALRIARNDQTDLPGFDEDLLARECGADFREKNALIEEFFTVRKASISLFNSFRPEYYTRTGSISGNMISVRALGYIMIGHQLHHLQVIKDKYLK